jgi:hypothetical protein
MSRYNHDLSRPFHHRGELLEEERIGIVRNRGQRQLIPLFNLLLDLIQLVEYDVLRVGTQRQSERRLGFPRDGDERAADCQRCE